jgi:hypothetical protein
MQNLREAQSSSILGESLHGSTRNYTIRGDYTTSDHLPVTIKLVLQDSGSRQTCYKTNTLYLQHLKVKEAVNKIWPQERRAASTFFTKVESQRRLDVY